METQSKAIPSEVWINFRPIRGKGTILKSKGKFLEEDSKIGEETKEKKALPKNLKSHWNLDRKC